VFALAGLLIGAGAIAWGASLIASEVRRAREEAGRGRTLAIAQLFAPAIGAAQSDPRVLLTWQPLARTMRAIFPDECAILDRAAGATFPFTTDRIQAAHAQWTAEWLAWERSHDAEYKARAADAQGNAGRLDLIEREKLDTYQRRYEEYIRVARALQALVTA
jgi:hypothetical protein